MLRMTHQEEAVSHLSFAVLNRHVEVLHMPAGIQSLSYFGKMFIASG